MRGGTDCHNFSVARLGSNDVQFGYVLGVVTPRGIGDLARVPLVGRLFFGERPDRGRHRGQGTASQA